MSKGLLFIHGSGLGRYIWDDTIRALEMPALAVDFPNRGKAENANRGLTLKDYTTHILGQMEGWQPDKVIIVAHSVAGVLALQLAQDLGSRLAGIIAIGAAIPASGGSFISCLPAPQRYIMPLILRLAGTRPPESALRSGLCHDLDDEIASLVVKRFTPESRFLFTQRCDAGIPDKVFRAYIKLTDDREFSVSMQDKMAANLKAKKVLEMRSGHLPMLSDPLSLSRLLKELSVQL